MRNSPGGWVTDENDGGRVRGSRSSCATHCLVQYTAGSGANDGSGMGRMGGS